MYKCQLFIKKLKRKAYNKMLGVKNCYINIFKKTGIKPVLSKMLYFTIVYSSSKKGYL